MAVKVTDIKTNARTKKAVVDLFADQQSDITAQMKPEGLPKGYTIDFGSSVITAAGEMAFMKSDGQWSWL